MTTEQLRHIVVDVLGNEMDKIIHLEGCRQIIICDTDRKSPKLDFMRFRFDTTNEVLELIPTRPRVIMDSKTNKQKVFEEGETVLYDYPSHDNYEIRDGIVYEYLTDDDGKMIFDSVDFGYVNMIILDR